MLNEQNKKACPCGRYEICQIRPLSRCIMDCPLYQKYLQENDRLIIGFDYEKDKHKNQ